MRHNVRLFIRFLKSETALLLSGVAVFIITVTVQGLYRMPLEGVMYSIILILFLFTVLLLLRFKAFAKRYSQLRAMTISLQSTLNSLDTFCVLDSSSLPSPSTAMEEAYIHLLCIAADCIRELNDSAKRNETEMGEYYTMWVHQIKTPITVMRLLLADTTSELGKKLSTELFRIEQYADMALTYTRLTDGNSDYVLKEYHIDSIARRAVRKYAPLFIAKRITLNYNDIEIKTVTDEKWLQFCIEQLLSNAVKYTDYGSVTVSCIVGADYDMLIIKDTGMGIAAEDIPRVFDMGYTGYNGRADKKSTGIGLYLCKKAWNGIGHDIKVDSVVGKGTCVSILFNKNDTKYE